MEYVALSTAISMLGLTVLLFWAYPKYRLDVFRQNMFELRDELFMLAADGKIAFDDHAYTSLRMTMNGFLRFGHRLSLLQIVICFVTGGSVDDADFIREECRWNANIAKFDIDMRNRLNSIRQRMHENVLRQIVLGAPFLAITLIVPLLMYLFSAEILRKFGKTLERLDSTALNFGQ